MTRIKALVIVVALAISSAALAQDPCPCVPLSQTWTVTACETWTCAASALVAAEGNPNVMVLPSTSTQYKWVILRRVPSGTATISPDAPFLIEQFSTMLGGSTRFMNLDPTVAPLLVTAADGNVVVAYLRQAQGGRARAVGH